MSRAVPVSLRSLKEYGPRAWAETGQWPVSEQEFRLIVDSIDGAYETIYSSLDGVWRSAHQTDSKFFEWMKQFVHAQVVRNRCETIGADEATSYYAPLPTPSYRLGLRDSRSSVLEPLKQARRQWLANSHQGSWRRVRAFGGKDGIWSLGEVGRLKRDYLRNEKTSCVVISPGSLFDGGFASVDIPQGPRDVVGAVLSESAKVWSETLGVNVPLKHLLDLWLERTSYFGGCIVALSAQAKFPETLLVGSPGNALSRAAASVARTEGAEVIVFQHGHNPGTTFARTLAHSEFTLGQSVACATSGMAEAFRQLAARFSFSANKNTKFQSVKSRVYEEMRQVFLGYSSNKAKGRVVMVGYPMNTPAPRLSYGYGDFFALQIPLELKVVDTLKRCGYQVVYKAHPDTASLVAPLFSDDVEVEKDMSFEATLLSAETVVFTYPLTSALGIALTSDRPIVMLDLAGRDWVPEVYADLARRCAMVPATLDDRNFISVNEGALIDGLVRAPDLVCDDYFVKYMSQA
ncbi:MAG: hypothetical protein RID42_07465 [Alphaproteobacteria bacterium]